MPDARACTAILLHTLYPPRVAVAMAGEREIGLHGSGRKRARQGSCGNANDTSAAGVFSGWPEEKEREVRVYSERHKSGRVEDSSVFPSVVHGNAHPHADTR